ncbi:olfactory receptor 1E16-like [Hyperolius riggenbachi]|uniref:olfactory receptor 1E16-like n=1 Tax=Hyperolius riggenbachi TaxID=752182 RepID=UPI0035A29058
MDEKNVTFITAIHLLGFRTPQCILFLIFFIFLVVYCMIICGNCLIIVLVLYSKTLHSPMYFFLSQLSLSDILLATDILPNFLHVILVDGTSIPFFYCIVQFYFFGVAGTLQCFILTVMSYDRYLAICKPLHYTSIINHQVCCIIVVICWALSALVILVHTLYILTLTFCGPNIIDHFFCDLDPLLELSCTDTTTVQLEAKLLSTIFIFIPFCAITVSYVYIILTIFEIPSITGRQKAFSTCSSHLSVVSMYYGTLVCVYLVPRNGKSWNITKSLSLLYIVVTPLLNPVIYSLRNKDLKTSLRKLTNKYLHFQFR